jgi:hypothetical protein
VSANSVRRNVKALLEGDEILGDWEWKTTNGLRVTYFRWKWGIIVSEPVVSTAAPIVLLQVLQGDYVLNLEVPVGASVSVKT